MNKKGMFDQLGALAKGITVMAIVLVVVFLIMSNLSTNASVKADGNATKTVQTLTASLATIPGWVPLLVIVVIGALILSALFLFR